MSSQQPPLGSPVPESDGDVDTFAWRNVTPRTRLAMKRLLGLSGDSDIALAARFGTPPSAEVVDPCWTVLRDTWLASTSAAPARSRIIAALCTAGIGDPALETSQSAFLTVVVTGNGTREWQWYSRNPEETMGLVNQAVTGYEPFPIQFSIQDDPQWEAYRRFQGTGG